MLRAAPGGREVFWIVQWTPFQRSASGKALSGPVTMSPTAVQAVEVVHDTAARLVILGLGMIRAFQPVPFQVSESARNAPPPS